MTEREVHELVGMLLNQYPDFPLDREETWVNALALADTEAAFEAARLWCKYHHTWPLIAEITEIIRRMTLGMTEGKRRMWEGYLAECQRQGREPTFEWLMPEAV